MLGLGRAKNVLRTIIATHRRSTVVRALHNFASFVDSAWRNEGSEFATNGERFVLEKLRSANFRTAIDAGANLGDWSRGALEKWPICHVHAFEVAPATFEGLAAEIGRLHVENRVNAYQIGLSDNFDVQTMYYFPDSPQLTCDAPRHVEYKSIPFEARFTTLDRFCDEQGLDVIDFLKIDVEGAEHRVVKGALQRIKANRIACIQFEYGAFSVDTRFLLRDYYELLRDQFWIGKIYPNYVDFCEYNWTMENFKFCNYLCVNKNRRDLLDLIQR